MQCTATRCNCNECSWDNIGFMYSGPRLIRPLGNLASYFIGFKSSTYFEVELSGGPVKWSLNWAPHLIGPNSSAYFEAELSGPHCIYLLRKCTGLRNRNLRPRFFIYLLDYITLSGISKCGDGKKINLSPKYRTLV